MKPGHDRESGRMYQRDVRGGLYSLRESFRLLRRGKRMRKSVGILGSCVALFALAACSGSGNPAADVNVALEKYIAAQAAYQDLGRGSSTDTMTSAWLTEQEVRLQEMRSTFDTLEAEAQAVDFPEVSEGPGKPAQATIDEYLAATDALVTMEEQLLAQVNACVASGGTIPDCSMRVGSEALIGIYPDVLKRAQAASMELASESSRG